MIDNKVPTEKEPKEPISRLYESIVNDGYELPAFDVFKNDMGNPESLKKLHDTLKNDGYDLPEFNQFSSELGLKKKGGINLFGYTPQVSSEKPSPLSPLQSQSSSKKTRHSEIAKSDAVKLSENYQNTINGYIDNGGSPFSMGIDMFGKTSFEQSREGKTGKIINNFITKGALSSGDLKYLNEAAPVAAKQVVKTIDKNFNGKLDPSTIDGFVSKFQAQQKDQFVQSEASYFSNILNTGVSSLKSLGFDDTKAGNELYLKQFQSNVTNNKAKELSQLNNKYPLKMDNPVMGAPIYTSGNGTPVREKAAEYNKERALIEQKYNKLDDALGRYMAAGFAKKNPNADPLLVGLEYLKYADPIKYKTRVTANKRTASDRDISEIGTQVQLTTTTDINNLKNISTNRSLLDERFPEQKIAEVNHKLAAELYKSDNWFMNLKPSSEELEKAVSQLTDADKIIYEKYIKNREARFIGTDIPQTGAVNKFAESIITSGNSTRNFIAGVIGARGEDDRSAEILNQPFETRYQNVGESPMAVSRLEQLNEKVKTTPLSAQEINEKFELEKYTNIVGSVERFINNSTALAGQVAWQALLTKGVGGLATAGARSIGLLRAEQVAAGLTTEDIIANQALDFGVKESFLNSIAGSAIAYTNSYDDAVKQASQLGLSGAKAEVFASVVATANAATERIFKDEKILDAFKREIAPNISSIVAKLGTEKMTKEVFETGVRKIIKDGFSIIKATEIETVKETVEESATSAITSAAIAALAPDHFTVGAAMNDLTSTMTSMFIDGQLVGAIAGVKEFRANRLSIPLLNKIGSDVEFTNSINNAINVQFQNGLLTKEEADDKKKIVNEIGRVNKVVMPQVDQVQKLPVNARGKYAIALANEGLLKEKIKNTTDEALKLKYNDQVKASEEMRLGILNQELIVDDKYNVRTVEEANEYIKNGVSIPFELTTYVEGEHQNQYNAAIDNLVKQGMTTVQAGKKITQEIAIALQNSLPALLMEEGIKSQILSVTPSEGGYTNTESNQYDISPNVIITLDSSASDEDVRKVMETANKAADQQSANAFRAATEEEINSNDPDINGMLAFGKPEGMSDHAFQKLMKDLHGVEDTNGKPFLTGHSDFGSFIGIGGHFYEGSFIEEVNKKYEQIQKIFADNGVSLQSVHYNQNKVLTYDRNTTTETADNRLDQSETGDKSRVRQESERLLQQTKSIYSNVFKQLAETKQPTGENRQQSRVEKIITNVQKSLNSTGVKVKIIDDQTDFEKQVGQEGLGGVFISTDGTILINKQSLENSINSGRIIFHEGAHPVMNIIRNTNKPLYDKVVAGMKAAAKGNQAVNASVQWANRNYVGQAVMNDEALIETIAKIADGTLDPSTIPAGFKQDIIDFINAIAKVLGLPTINDTNIGAFKSVATQVATALREGRDVSEIVGTDNVTDYQNEIPTENQNRANEVFDGILDKIGISFGSVNEKTGNKKVTNFDVASALNKYYKKAFKTLRVDDFGKKALDIVSEYGTDEVIYSMSKFGKESGKGWYTEDYNAALTTMQKLDPDILNNPEIKEIATVVIAISSNSTDVATNLTRIIYALDQYKKNKNIPTDVGTGKAIEAIASGVDRYNRLLQNFGGDVNALKEFLQTIRPVSESKKALIEKLGVSSYAKVLDQDLGTNPEWNEDEVLPTSVIIFGPKIGAFYSNLSGLGGTPTIDRWCIRTMYRYRGDMKAKVSSSDLEGFVKENGLEGQATGNIVALADAHGKLFNAILTGKGEFKGMSKQERNAALKPYRKGSQISDKLSGVVNDIKDGITDKVENAAKYSRDFRTFTKKAFEEIQKKVEAKIGETLDISDIQAILWIYEKNLFGAMGVKQREDSTYSAAANTLVNKVESGSISIENLKAGKVTNIDTEGVIEEGAMGDKIDIPVKSYKDGLDDQPKRANEPLKTQARKDDIASQRLAPNGKPSNLNEQQYNQVRTPEFKAWFGDWENDPENASKVVDENGEPRVVFHGTNKQFDEFKKDLLGSKNWAADSAYTGFFFAGDRSTSEAYTGINSADLMGLNLGNSPIIQNVLDKYGDQLKEAEAAERSVLDAEVEKTQKEHLDMLKPIIEKLKQDLAMSDETVNNFIDSLRMKKISQETFTEAARINKDNGNTARLQDIKSKMLKDTEDAWLKQNNLTPTVMNLYLNIKNPYVYNFNDESEDTDGLTSHVKKAKVLGADGVVFKNLSDGADIDDIFVAFEPNQIKSATDNSGAFSKNDNRIQTRVDDNSDEQRDRGFSKTFDQRDPSTLAKISEDAKTYFVTSNKQTAEEVAAFIEDKDPEDVLDYLLSQPTDISGRVRIWMSGVVMDKIDEAIVAAQEAGDNYTFTRLTTKQADLINQISPLGTELGQAIQAFRRFYQNSKGSPAMLNYFTNNVVSKIEKALGRKLTEQELQNVKDSAKKIQEAPEGLPKDEATFELSNYVGTITPLNAMDIAEAIWYAHILSGITTQSTNFFANFWNTFAEGTVTGIRESIKTRSLMPMIYGAKGFLGGLVIGARDGADVLMTGLTPQDADKYSNSNILEYMTWKQTKVGKLLNGKVGGVLDYAGGLSPKVLKYVGRALAATDAAFSRANSEAISNMMAYTQALEEGKTQPDMDIKKRVSEILNKTSEKVAEAQTQAADEGYSKGSRRYKKRVYQILEQGRDKNMLKEAAIYGKKVTLNYEPEGFMRPVYQLALGLQQSTKLTKMFLPFTRIVVNITENSLNYTPAGFWKAARGTTSTDGGRRNLTRDERADFAIKASLGLATFVGLAALTGDDEDDLFDITANGSGNIVKNYELRKSGWRPYSIKLKSGRYISYKDWPIMPILSALGAMHDHNKYSKEDEPADNSIIALQGMVFSLYDKSVMKGLQDFVEILSPKQEYNQASKFGDRIVNWGADQAKTLAISNFTQQAIKFTGEYMDNPIKAAKGVERIYRDIPYLNDGLNPIIDVFGEPVTPSTSEKLLPITVGKPSKDMLLAVFNENGIFIGKPQTKDIFIDDDGATRPMTDKEYYDYTKKAGQITKQLLIEEWDDVKDILKIKDKKERQAELQAFTNNIISGAREEAMEMFYE